MQSRCSDLPYLGWKRRSLLPNSKNYASNLLDMTRGAYFGNPKMDDVQYYSLFQKEMQSGLGLKKYEDKSNLENKVHRMAC